ncbi:hypothetical protein J4E89_001812 [Alternaria sp. Ai002NY15]|nr:hypothetical protein J4E89_001812 [Alternaria sp. Ai002NY15]
MANEQDYFARQGALQVNTQQNMSNTCPPDMTAEEEAVGDLDEPPEPRAQRPAPLVLQHSSSTSFTKSKPVIDRKASLLTSALKSGSNASSPVEEHSDASPVRGMSCVSTWSNNSGTADLTSDGGFTSPGTRPCTPSPPLPSAAFHSMLPTFNNKPLELPISVVSHDDENITPVPKTAPAQSTEQSIEAVLGRKRRIMFACGPKEDKKPAEAPAKPAPAPAPQAEEPPKRVCTIKFACPSKPSTEAAPKPRRMASPAPPPRRIPSSPKPTTKVHRDSDSTVRNNSPVSVRKVRPVDHTRRLSSNSDLARCEAYRFHEFASSEEEVEEWTQEVTCHRSRLTVQDTLKIENNLRKLGEEVAEEEAIDEEDEDDDEDNVEMDDDDDDLLDEDEDAAYSDATDEGFQTDDENGFAVSDDDSDAGSDYDWWAPGASTAATSVEHLEQLRLKTHRTVSESSIGSLESREGLKIMDKPSKRRKSSKPVNIRVPTPELPDSTDFVCGTLDEDRPAEAAYMSTLERRRAAKHKPTPQDIDPTFPTSDPELPDDDEDEVSEDEKASETDHLMIHGRMDPVNIDGRGRRKEVSKKRSPLPSPKRLRSPPPAKRAVHRSPPPRKLFGNSPKRHHSPPPPMRLRSPPPTRRGSVNPVNMTTRQRSDTSIRFAGIAERPAPTVSASVPRTPITMRNPFDLDEDEDADGSDMPIRRAIDIKVGLEKKRQRRKEKLYRKQHRKGAKEKRPAPGRGAERMREMGLAVHAHKGKTNAFQPFGIRKDADEEDMHVLSA